MDVDNDGKISRVEAMGMFMELTGEVTGTPTPLIEEQLGAYFDKSDTNGDGFLQEEEFYHFCNIVDGLATVLANGVSQKGDTTDVQQKPHQPYVEQKPAPEGNFSAHEMFSRHDANSDAKLDVEEATMLIKATVQEMGLTDEWVTSEFVKAQIARVDTDGDASTLTQDEYTAFMENVMGFLSQLGSVLDDPNKKEPAAEEQQKPLPTKGDDDDAAAEPSAAQPCACVIC